MMKDIEKILKGIKGGGHLLVFGFSCCEFPPQLWNIIMEPLLHSDFAILLLKNFHISFNFFIQYLSINLGGLK